MTSTIVLVLVATAAYLASSRAYQLRRNVLEARKSGLPYIVVPCSPIGTAWQIVSRWLLPFIRYLPRWMWEDWLFTMKSDWGYENGQEPFERLGDTFLVVSYDMMIMYTQDPYATHQITSRREQFPKATQIYGVLNIYGKNVVTTEGVLWRLHRKATSASFNEHNAACTFAEAIRQTRGMLALWTRARGPEARSPAIATLQRDTMTLALNIISYVGFGLRLAWPGQTDAHLDADMDVDVDESEKKYGGATPPAGHSMTFATSVEHVLHRILYLLVLPSWLLRVLGLVLEGSRDAYEANANFKKYMHELLADKEAAVRADNDRAADGGMDIMGQLVRRRIQDKRQTTDVKGGKGRGNNGLKLSDDEIIGNAFIMFLAGHETTANTLHFALVMLATHPASQRAVQADVDRLLGRRSDPASWSYEANINGLLASMLGAVMNETLRLIPPVVIVPKRVPLAADQTLTVQSRADGSRTQVVVPAGTMIQLSVVTAHRHPAYWPAQPSRITPGQPRDLDDFVPERWLLSDGAKETEGDATVDGADTEDYGGFQGPDTSAQLFRPVRGSFVPFSDGPRSCLGRRIAQVEIVAALAMIFQRYSIELAVDDFVPLGADVDIDDAINVLDPDARRAVYAQAQHRSRETLRSARTLLTLKLHSREAVPVRLVPRGQEQFMHVVDV